ncbi:MAG: hypothetical protein ACP5QR_09615 [Rhizomicrobium sp.]
MKPNPSIPPTPMLHDLAEGTQALGNYLTALQLSLSGNAHNPEMPQIVDRALLQYARIVETMHALDEDAHVSSL